MRRVRCRRGRVQSSIVEALGLLGTVALAAMIVLFVFGVPLAVASHIIQPEAISLALPRPFRQLTASQSLRPNPDARATGRSTAARTACSVPATTSRRRALVAAV